MPEAREDKGLNGPTLFHVCEMYEFHDGEEDKTYVWNATAGRLLAEERNADFELIDLADMGMTPETILRYCPELDKERARALPPLLLLIPILFVPHRGKHVLIDGWHRLYRAALSGMPYLPAYVLTEQEERMIRLRNGGGGLFKQGAAVQVQAQSFKKTLEENGAT